MFNGNLYGLIITMLTFVIAVVLTMRQVEHTGVRVEFTIRPVAAVNITDIPEYRIGDQEARRRDRRDGVASQPASGKAPQTP
jgi:hypothetical protein